MSIRASGKVEQPDSVEVTLSLTMSVKEWLTLTKNLSDATYPNWKVVGLIRDTLQKMLGQLTNTTETLE